MSWVNPVDHTKVDFDKYIDLYDISLAELDVLTMFCLQLLSPTDRAKFNIPSELIDPDFLIDIIYATMRLTQVLQQVFDGEIVLHAIPDPNTDIEHSAKFAKIMFTAMSLKEKVTGMYQRVQLLNAELISQLKEKGFGHLVMNKEKFAEKYNLPNVTADDVLVTEKIPPEKLN